MIWHKESTTPFKELILSWNGIRPKNGAWTFWVSIQEGPWLKYAEWGAEGQKSFNQDIVIAERLCTEFRVKVEGEELEGLRSLHPCLFNPEEFSVVMPEELPPVLLDVPGRSQITLNHPRCKDLCSPTSVATALNYLLGSKKIDPVAFAKCVYDEKFDIYGNWILNTAECYNQTQIPCHVARLASFKNLHAELMAGRPVVASVKGIIPGAPKPYHHGHLMCITGYEKGRVYCIDSAFDSDEKTRTSYHLNDFLAAWGLRRNLAYIFR